MFVKKREQAPLCGGEIALREGKGMEMRDSTERKALDRA